MAEIRISKLSENVSFVSELEDRPNLSADNLKKIFDKGSEVEKKYINDSLVPDIEKAFKLIGNESVQNVNDLTKKIGAVSSVIGTGGKPGVYGGIKILNYAILWGKVSFEAAANIAIPKVVEFPIKFKSSPVTIVSADTTAPQNLNVGVDDYDDTTAGYSKVKFHLYRTTKHKSQIHWITIGRYA